MRASKCDGGVEVWCEACFSWRTGGARIPLAHLAHKNPPPLLDHHRALEIVLLQGPRGGQFLMSELPL